MKIDEMTAFGDDRKCSVSEHEPKGAKEVLNLKEDEPFKRFFSRTQPLSIILKGVAPEFKNYEPKEIEKCIEVEFTDKDPGVEFDSTTKMLNGSSGTDSEATTEFDVYFKVNLPDGRSERFALFIDLEMQQNFKPGYHIEKRGVYYPARMLSKQLGSLEDKKAYDSLQKVHSIWIFTSRYEKALTNSVLTYSIRRTRTPERLLKSKAVKELDANFDLMDISFVFIGDKVDEGTEEVIEFLNACFYNKDKLVNNNRWVDSKDHELRKEARIMGNFKELYEERGEERGKEIGKEIGKVSTIRKSLGIGLSDYDIVNICSITEENLAEIKRLLDRYPDKTDDELATLLLTEKELV